MMSRVSETDYVGISELVRQTCRALSSDSNAPSEQDSGPYSMRRARSQDTSINNLKPDYTSTVELGSWDLPWFSPATMSIAGSKQADKREISMTSQ
jgi:hypothetical protein